MNKILIKAKKDLNKIKKLRTEALDKYNTYTTTIPILHQTVGSVVGLSCHYRVIESLEREQELKISLLEMDSNNK